MIHVDASGGGGYSIWLDLMATVAARCRPWPESEAASPTHM